MLYVILSIGQEVCSGRQQSVVVGTVVGSRSAVARGNSSYYLCVSCEYACLSLVRKKGVVVGTHLAVLGAVGNVLAFSAQQHLLERLAAVGTVAQPDRKGHLALVRWGELGGLACGRGGDAHTNVHAESNQCSRRLANNCARGPRISRCSDCGHCLVFTLRSP
jgi:hypothetical protein